MTEPVVSTDMTYSVAEADKGAATKTKGRQTRALLLLAVPDEIPGNPTNSNFVWCMNPDSRRGRTCNCIERRGSGSGSGSGSKFESWLLQPQTRLKMSKNAPEKLNFDNEALKVFAQLANQGGSSRYNHADIIWQDSANGGKLFIGNQTAASQRGVLDSLGISRIVNCTSDVCGVCALLYHENGSNDVPCRCQTITRANRTSST